MELKDAKVLITGGSLGIGKATAANLTAAGATVVITGRDADRLGPREREPDVREDVDR